MRRKVFLLILLLSVLIGGLAMAFLKSLSPTRPLIYGYCLAEDAIVNPVMEDELRLLDYLILNACRLDDVGRLTPFYDKSLIDLALRYRVKLILMVNSEALHWPMDTLGDAITDPSNRDRFIDDLITELNTRGYSGISFDLQDLGGPISGVSFLKEAYQKFHEKGYEVLVILRPSDAKTLTLEFQDFLDHAILLTFPENPLEMPQGAINQTLSTLPLPREKLVVALGSFGKNLEEATGDYGNTMGFSQFLALAKKTGADIQWRGEMDGLSFYYSEAGKNLIAWFLDAPAAYNTARNLVGQNLAGYAVWGIGLEDPSIWQIVRCLEEREFPDPMSLSRIPYPSQIDHSGEGDILQIMSPPMEGQRKMVLDEHGYIREVALITCPHSLSLVKCGAPGAKQILLTFDDGPDPRYTPRVLDILKEEEIKAVFFVIGRHGLLYPNLLKRIYEEGHEIGNHTFNHKNPAKTSAFRLKLELEAAQLVIQSTTGRSTILYRPPENKGLSHSLSADIAPSHRAQELGYVIVDQSIDPLDWTRAEPETIVERILSEVESGHTILLHDGGGDRENTVRALPLLIEALRDRGFSFVTPSSLLDRTRDDIMPPVNTSDNLLLEYAQTVFCIIRGFYIGFTWACLFATAVGIFRLFFLILFALRHYRRKPRFSTERPRVSVIIPAYNEEEMIYEAVRSVIDNDYPDFEIIVVDDGSTDNTGRIVLEAFGHDRRVHLITQDNCGKASALNVGVNASNGKIVLAMDGDTSLDRKALSLLVAYFEDPTVGAVSGNVRVRNRHSPLTLFQHIEYVTGFNLERRAFSELNCITVVPGAIGAWQRESIVKAGGFKSDTLAEDADLTMTLLRQGDRVIYEQNAIAYTEVPIDLKSLINQRFRWCYGTLQCLWKHRGALLNPRLKSLGFVALPHIWLFQYGFQTLSPLIDMFFITSLMVGNIVHPALFYLAFFLIDLVASLTAFNLGKEEPRPLFWLFLQRVAYRFLMVFVVVRSLVFALKGEPVGWGKAHRR